MIDKDNQDEFSENLDESGDDDFGDGSGDDFSLPEFGAEDDFGSGNDDFSSGNDDFSSGNDDFSSGGDDFSSGGDDFSSGGDAGSGEYVGSIFGSDLDSGGSGGSDIENDTNDAYSYEEEPESESKGGSSKSFILVIVLVCILLAGGGATYLLLTDNKDIVSALSKPDSHKESDTTQTKSLDSAALATEDSLKSINKDSISADTLDEAKVATSDTERTTEERTTEPSEEKKEQVIASSTEERTSTASTSNSTSSSDQPKGGYNRPSERGFGNVDKERSASRSYGSSTRSDTRLSGPTGRAYIIVASFSEPNRADNYANELSNKGHQAVIIPPFRAAPYHRVAIADYSSFREAFQNRRRYISEFGPTIWVISYK